MSLCIIYGYVRRPMQFTVTATCHTSLSAQNTPLRDVLECESKTPEDSLGPNIVSVSYHDSFLWNLLGVAALSP